MKKYDVRLTAGGDPKRVEADGFEVVNGWIEFSTGASGNVKTTVLSVREDSVDMIELVRDESPG